MRQSIETDPYGIDAWDTNHSSRCFVTMTDANSWYQLTGLTPPTPPLRARNYQKAGMPWFEYYAETRSPLNGSSILAKVKSIMAHLGPKNGIEGANDSIKPTNIIDLGNPSPYRVIDEGEGGTNHAVN